VVSKEHLQAAAAGELRGRPWWRQLGLPFLPTVMQRAVMKGRFLTQPQVTVVLTIGN